MAESCLSLYILQFDEAPLIKIGLTENFPFRLKAHRKSYRENFDLQASFLIGCYSGSILRNLERTIKSNISNFRPKDEWANYVKGKKGSTEVFEYDALETILKQIAFQQQLYNNLYLYAGISLEENIKLKLPEVIFDNDGQIEYKDVRVCKALITSLNKKFMKQVEGYSFEEEVNFYLLKLIEKEELEIETTNDNEYERTERLYYANDNLENWRWVKPKK